MALSRYSSRTTPFTNTQSSTSNSRPMKLNKRGTSSTLDMAEPASWCTRQRFGRTKMNHGHMLTSWKHTMSLSALPPTLSCKRSQSCGYDGCNTIQWASLDQTHATTLEFLSFHALIFLGTRLILLTLHMSSALATSSLLSTLDGPTTSWTHPSVGTQKGTGALTMQTGMV